MSESQIELYQEFFLKDRNIKLLEEIRGGSMGQLLRAIMKV